MEVPQSQLWDSFLTGSLTYLNANHLTRTLRPLVNVGSAVRATVSAADLQCWANGLPPTPLQSVAAARCPELQQQRPAHSPPICSPYVGDESVEVTLFSSNDYLGLSTHPDVAEAASRAASQTGMGVRSSALVAGYSHLHRELELELAALKGTRDCLLFPTGFAANMAAIAALCGAPAPGTSTSSSSSSSEPVTIFSDELNHASIIDGARLATRGGSGGAQLRVFRHNDLAHLEQLLVAAPPRGRRVVVTESLFSMDGDFADLQGLVALKRRHGFLLVVDEAHATLVCGERGGGACEAAGVCEEVDLHVGTLSKAFGCLGGFVATSTAWKSFLLNRGRPFIFSTSLPTPVVAAAQAAIRVSLRETWRRKHVWQLVDRLGSRLGVLAESPIVPLVLGPEEAAMRASATLLTRHLHVPAIRPPTVPAGTCRLRVSLSAAHTVEDVDRLVDCLAGASFLPRPAAAVQLPASRL